MDRSRGEVLSWELLWVPIEDSQLAPLAVPSCRSFLPFCSPLVCCGVRWARDWVQSRGPSACSAKEAGRQARACRATNLCIHRERWEGSQKQEQ
eukprot:scaffold429_cov114-Cylindrotheca_fusiformis.AAC.8